MCTQVATTISVLLINNLAGFIQESFTACHTPRGAIKHTHFSLNESLTWPIRKMNPGPGALPLSSVSTPGGYSVSPGEECRLSYIHIAVYTEAESTIHFPFSSGRTQSCQIKMSMICNFICKLRTETWLRIYYFQLNVFPSLRTITKPRLCCERQHFN